MKRRSNQDLRSFARERIDHPMRALLHETQDLHRMIESPRWRRSSGAKTSPRCCGDHAV
jgi:hypothetical protein